ncbi:MAG: hypothetical protein EXX96DRAFT_556557 [Benjaminiella poitrasii]|nr:MAG: hypothetical protein EXX96DRAFT_556557 [Benjaminiella poitrasii]
MFIFRNALSLLGFILILCQTVIHAQLGPVIISPEQNATIPAGGKVEISYQYQNMGTGNYSVDIQLWQDAAVTTPISDIVRDHAIKSGTSSGVKISFVMNDTYSWNVQHGLNKTFWLTVTETAQTAFYPKGIALRSRPVLLHTSDATTVLSRPAMIASLSISLMAVNIFITMFI